MHVLAAPAILACAHELVVAASASAPVLAALDSFLVNDGHAVEIVVREVEVLSDLVLHIFTLDEIDRQLLDFETVFVVDLMSQTASVLTLARLLSEWLPSGLALVVRERYL